MPAIPTSNNGSVFYNINDCKSFNQVITTALQALSSYPCSEVIIYNKTGQSIYVYDNQNFDASNRLLLLNNDEITLRGITNTAQVSAQSLAGSGTLYYRTQFFSNLPQR